MDGWVWGGRWSRKCSRAERPWVWGMFVYREETSTVAIMVSGGRRVGRDRIISRNWLVSWTMGGVGFNKRMEVGVDVDRDVFSGRTLP